MCLTFVRFALDRNPARRVTGIVRSTRRLYRDRRGALSFEWILLLTLASIGIVGGLSATRDAVISELGDVAGGMVALDQSFHVRPDPCFHLGGFQFRDQLCNTASTCRPAEPPPYQQSGR